MNLENPEETASGFFYEMILKQIIIDRYENFDYNSKRATRMWRNWQTR